MTEKSENAKPLKVRSHREAGGGIRVAVVQEWSTTGFVIMGLAAFYGIAERFSLLICGAVFGATGAFLLLGGIQDPIVVSLDRRKVRRQLRFMGVPVWTRSWDIPGIAFIAVGTFGYDGLRAGFTWEYRPLLFLTDGRVIPFSKKIKERGRMILATQMVAQHLQVPYREMPENREFIQPIGPLSKDTLIPTRDAEASEMFHGDTSSRSLMRTIGIVFLLGFAAAVSLHFWFGAP